MMHVLKEGDPITITLRTPTDVYDVVGEFTDLVYGQDGQVSLEYYLATQRDGATDLLALEDVVAIQFSRLARR